MAKQLERILYVDDEPVLRQLVQMALQAFGNCKVEVCDDGSFAVDHARRFNPDVIVLDVMMPGLDGPGVFSQLKKEPDLKHIPVIFMTAKAYKTEIDILMRLGIAGVLTKPFDPTTLLSQIQAIWEKSHAA